MPTSKKPGAPSAKPTSSTKTAARGDSASANAGKQASAKAAARNTASGPARSGVAADALAQHQRSVQELSSGLPYNANKKFEHGRDNAVAPPVGETAHVDDPSATGSTLSEHNFNEKVGTLADAGTNAANASLDRVRVDSSDQALTTNQGVAVADNQNSLKAGLRGPTLLEDFILREKITHFDHERIPERVVHARGSGAHGFFECYAPLTRYTRAAPFQEAGKITPVFVRFSTVAGERGSTDLARDVRGFAVKFYTDEGNWDLVGNNMPVFFIQDAMKFPDLVHAVKPEPHNAIPQAASAHDTFWDFASLMPEITHMLMWVMSDRAIPRSLRMMQGFGVHTFRLVNEAGESVFCKFHWNPSEGTHSLVWDEAVKMSGADSDFHRRDLWEAIEAGAYPEWELGLQIFTEEQAESFSFDILDPTKIVPEELIPVTPVGRMVLNRNPDNFFAETEQVAFCTAHVVPGIDFSNDPLLAGRIHSYVDTQITRLGGPNFHEIPINAPAAQVHNNQRDGMHRQALPRGRVAYEPNSLAGGCPFQAGTAGFVSFPEPIHDDKVRGKPEKFADHYTQARLFYESQTEVEQAHIAGAFRFELSKVTVPAIRERMLSGLRNASEELASKVAEGLGMPLPNPMPRAIEKVAKPEVEKSEALSLLARPGNGGIRTRKIAILVAPGINAAQVTELQSALLEAGAVPRLVAARVGPVTPDSMNGGNGSDGAKGAKGADGKGAAGLDADASLENTPAVLFDALILPDGAQGTDALAMQGRALEFIRDTYRHCKTILTLGTGGQLLDKAGIPLLLPDGGEDPGIIRASQNDGAAQALPAFISAAAKHRHYERDTDPPRV